MYPYHRVTSYYQTLGGTTYLSLVIVQGRDVCVPLASLYVLECMDTTKKSTENPAH